MAGRAHRTLNVAEIARRLARWRCAPQFDRRPGDLEATRGLRPEVRVIGAIGKRGQLGWHVALQLEIDGRPAHVPLPLDEARSFAAHLAAMADYLEFGVPE